MTALVIRPERAGDHDAIRQVVTAAFGSAAEADLVERIRASQAYEPSTALVADLDGHVVGHMMISAALLRNDQGERTIAMLSPLAVDPEHHGEGVGGALVRAVTAIADARGRGSHAAWPGRVFGCVQRHLVTRDQRTVPGSSPRRTPVPRWPGTVSGTERPS